MSLKAPSTANTNVEKAHDNVKVTPRSNNASGKGKLTAAHSTVKNNKN